jgi:hypothetical protein
MERSEGDVSLKNPVTPPGIDPRTVRLVAQRLNHYATPGPVYQITWHHILKDRDVDIHDVRTVNITKKHAEFFHCIIFIV